MSASGIKNLYVNQSGAVQLGEDAYSDITGATGAGGFYASSGFTGVTIFNAAAEAGVTDLPTGNPTSSNIYFTPVVIIGGTGSPVGDIRGLGDGTGYSGIGSTGYGTGETNFTGLAAGTNYSGTFYAVYEKAGAKHTGKAGVGTTAPSTYYENAFKTPEFFEFKDIYVIDTGDLSLTASGSGVYTDRNAIEIGLDISNRAGDALTNTAELQQDPFFDGLDINILDATGGVVANNYKSDYQHSLFAFSPSENQTVFGQGKYIKDFGVQIITKDQNSQSQTSNIQLRGNYASIKNIYVSASGGAFLDETTGNYQAPNTGAESALPFTNHQLVNTTGTKGEILHTLTFEGEDAFTEFDYTTVWWGLSGEFQPTPANSLGNFPTPSKVSTIRLTTDNGLPEKSGLYFKFRPFSKVMGGPIFGNGAYVIEPRLIPPDPFLKNQGNQSIISGNLSIGGSDAGGLYVKGGASGTGAAGRLTLGGTGYMLSGDAASSLTLQDVTDNGNTTTQSITIGAASSPAKTLDVRGTSLLSGNSSVSGTFTVSNDFSVENDTSKLIDTSLSSNKIVLGGRVADSTTNAPYEVAYEKAIISATNSNIYSTGSVIVGGSDHTITGDFDVIAGGTNNNISGGDFAFVGGGSGIDISHSDYSSSVGGYNNDIENAAYSVIGGGFSNRITGDAANFIGGGSENLISGTAATVAGGVGNKITGGGWSFIGGGEENTVTAIHGAIVGGEGNTVYGYNSTIGGGGGNVASGQYSFVGGGRLNKTSGDYSYAFGRKAEIGKDQDGAAVLADGQDRTHSSSGQHTLTLDFAGGVYVPATGFFNALHVSGVPVLTGENNPAEADTLQTVTARGATTNQAISITNTSTSALAVSTDALVVDGSNDRVGVGTASNISSKLDVYGNISVGADGYYAGSSPAPTDGMIIKGTVGIGTTSPSSASNLHVYGSGIFGTYTSTPTNGLVVEGNLGVGTSSPTTALDVRGTISGYTGLFDDKVGIGTNAPTEMLGIAPNTDVSAEIGRAHVGYIGHGDYAGFSHVDQNTTTNYAILQQSNGATYVNAANATNIYFRMNNTSVGGFNSSTDFYVDTDTLYVDASEDRVGINESSPSYTLDVTASDASSLLSRFYNSSSTNGQGLLIRAGETSNYNRILQCASRTDSKVMTVNSNGKVGIGTTEPTTTLEVAGDTNVIGHFAATSKSFLIDHPTKENKKLQYGSLEGPEHGVFIRGTTNKNVIKLPDYWKDLVHEDSITVTLTPVHVFQSLYVKSKTPEQIMVGGVEKSYDYVVYGQRKDIDKLEVEI